MNYITILKRTLQRESREMICAGCKWLALLPFSLIRYKLSFASHSTIEPWDNEKQDILERLNWLCEQVIVEPKVLLKKMPQILGPNYGGEWAIYSCAMLVFALYNIYRIYPNDIEPLGKMEQLIDITLSEPIRGYDTRAWHEDALKSLQGNNSHMTYLSLLAWEITNYKLVGGGNKYDTLLDSICEALNRRMLNSPDLNLKSFPLNIIFLPDMIVPVIALHNYAKLNNRKYQDTVQKWIDNAQSLWCHKQTGLLTATLSVGRKSKHYVRGSYAGLNTTYLALVDDDFAREQYMLTKQHLVKRSPIVGLREYLNCSPLFKFDPDTGPIAFGLSPSGTAFILGAATYFCDWSFRASLLRTAECAGITKKSKGKRHYRLGELALVGEAVTLAMRTMRKEK